MPPAQVLSNLGHIEAHAMAALNEEGKAIFSAIAAFIEAKLQPFLQLPQQFQTISNKLDSVSNQHELILSKLDSLEKKLADTQNQLLTLEKNHTCTLQKKVFLVIDKI